MQPSKTSSTGSHPAGLTLRNRGAYRGPVTGVDWCRMSTDGPTPGRGWAVPADQFSWAARRVGVDIPAIPDIGEVS
ncbi:hypothetical protein GCM10027026_17490 [Myroides odoratimimus subsp. xuanwuensis]